MLQHSFDRDEITKVIILFKDPLENRRILIACNLNID